MHAKKILLFDQKLNLCYKMLFSLHINNLALTLPCNPFKVKARIFVESLQLTYFLMTPHIKITFLLALKLCVMC